MVWIQRYIFFLYQVMPLTACPTSHSLKMRMSVKFLVPRLCQAQTDQ